MHSMPSGLCGYMIDEAHCVGADTGVMICRCSMCWRAFSICSWYSIGTFTLHVELWYWRVYAYCIGTWHVLYSIKRLWKCFFDCYNIANIAVVKWSCEIGTLCHEWSWNYCFWEEWSCKRDTIRGEWSHNDCFCNKWWWNVLIMMASFNGCCLLFLGLIGIYVWSGVLNAMFLLELMVSKVVDVTPLNIWNFTMPNLSDAAYYRSIFGLIVSWKT